MKRLSVFGATGSIGQNTLDLVRRDRANYHIVALTGSRNLDCLVRDALEFRPDCVVVADDSQYFALKDRLRGCEIDVLGGTSGLLDAADRPVDLAMSAIVGAAGLEPGLRAMAAGADLALANKESMVAAGALVKKTALDNGISLIPVDSEHSAVFQALIGEARDAVERVILTASGGAFLDWSLEELRKRPPNRRQPIPTGIWGRDHNSALCSISLWKLLKQKSYSI